MKKTNDRTVPLAFDDSGDPTPIPPEARFFRLKVRHGTARKPRLVRNESGAPFLLPLETRPEDLQEKMGPGIYRLELVDENGFGLQAPHFSYVIEREDDEEDPSASRAEAFVSKILKENRQLVTRVLDHIEQQSTERAEAQTKHTTEYTRLLATQAERFEKVTTALSEQNAKATSAMLEQNVKLVTVIANKFGDYIAESTNLLAAHPAAGNAPTAAEIVTEHKHIRNAVDDLSQGQGDSEDEHNPLLSLIDKSLDTALPVLAPALQRLVHRLLGLTEQQSSELSGVPTAPMVARGSGPVQALAAAPEPRAGPTAAPTPGEMARMMEVMNHLTVPERAAAMTAQQAMSDDERERLRVELLTLPTDEAVARARQILVERQGQSSASSLRPRCVFRSQVQTESAFAVPLCVVPGAR